MGYLNKEAETKAMIASNGWVHTGDMGWKDQHEFYHLEGKIKGKYTNYK